MVQAICIDTELFQQFLTVSTMLAGSFLLPSTLLRDVFFLLDILRSAFPLSYTYL